MKSKIFALAISGVFFTTTQAMAGNNCDRKIKNIENQISIAKRYNNTPRVLGLEKSLDQVKLNCQQNQYYYDKRTRNRDSNRHNHDRNRDDR